MVTELYKKGKFYTIQPHGKTASGEIIKTMITNTKNKEKNRYSFTLQTGHRTGAARLKKPLNCAKKQSPATDPWCELQ